MADVDPSRNYTVTIVFFPELTRKSNGWPSIPGHQFLIYRDPAGTVTYSHGWSFGESLSIGGIDNLSRTDHEKYTNRGGKLKFSSITVSITKEQHDSMVKYGQEVAEGKHPERSNEYHRTDNSCVTYSKYGVSTRRIGIT